MPQEEIEKIMDMFHFSKLESYRRDQVKRAMIEFGKQLLSLAAERATIKKQDEKNDWVGQYAEYFEVDPESITSCINLIKP